MIAPCASPVTVSGPNWWTRPEKFTGPPETRGRCGRDASATPVRVQVPTGVDRSGSGRLLVGDRVTGSVELERPDLDKARVQLAGGGELVRVGDTGVIHRVHVGVHLLRCGVAGIDSLEVDVAGVEGDVTVGAGFLAPLLLVVG